MLELVISDSYKESFGKIGVYQIDTTDLNLSIVISAKMYEESKLDFAMQVGLITSDIKQQYLNVSNSFIEGEIELEEVKIFPVTEIPPAIGMYYQQSIDFLNRLLLGYKTKGDVDMVIIKEWVGGIPYTGEPESINEIIQMYTDNNKIILVTH